MSKIPFFSLNIAPKSLKDEWRSAIDEVIESGQFIGGPQVKRFEESWADSVGVKHAVGVGNGLDGLVIALRALGVGSGDNVAVPAHTFIATWNAVKLVDANPIGIDVNELGLMNLDILESKNIDFKCVIPVHMHGAMVDMNRLATWARERQILIVEDASQSHMANFGDLRAGQASDIGVFSLYPTKNLGALGDAGIMVTDRDDLALQIRCISNYGASPSDKYFHETFGVNSRLDSIQAAVLNVNLGHLLDWNNRRREIARHYISKIKENSHFRILNKAPETSVWHHFPLVSNVRDQLINHLKSNGISTEIHYPRTASEEFYEITGLLKVEFPIAELLAKEIFSLPISPWHTNDEILEVCNVLNEFKPWK
jgi:dTDP-3-amino-3,4,6-trideoxy-alpha-D-glucose transaminase